MSERRLLGARRADGSTYLLITIVAFAITVIAVRVYLDAAGYPKLGGGGLHVAHMLWGGLLLIVAVLIGQLFAGRRAMALSAVAAGVGVGLFIDEVGKFVTESNDYFFAPAAPIIYGSVLLLALIWLRARRRSTPSAADAVQAAVEAVQDLAEGRLSRPDRDRAVRQLEEAGTAAHEGLAAQLLDILRSRTAEADLEPTGWVDRGEPRRWLRRLLPTWLERMVIQIGLILSALSALLGGLVAAVILAGKVTALEAPAGPLEYPSDPAWVLLLALVWVAVGACNAVALVLSLAGRQGRAMAIAQYAVLFNLVAGGLLNLYVSQLAALSDVLVLFTLLLLILDQRSRIGLARVTEGRPAGSTS